MYGVLFFNPSVCGDLIKQQQETNRGTKKQMLGYRALCDSCDCTQRPKWSQPLDRICCNIYFSCVSCESQLLLQEKSGDWRFDILLKVFRCQQVLDRLRYPQACCSVKLLFLSYRQLCCPVISSIFSSVLGEYFSFHEILSDRILYSFYYLLKEKLHPRSGTRSME